MKKKEELQDNFPISRPDLDDLLYGKQEDSIGDEEMSLGNSHFPMSNQILTDRVRTSGIKHSTFRSSGFGPKMAVTGNQQRRMVRQASNDQSSSELLYPTCMVEPKESLSSLSKRSIAAPQKSSVPNHITFFPSPNLKKAVRKESDIREGPNSVDTEEEFVINSKRPCIPDLKTLNPKIEPPIPQLSSNDKYLAFLEGLNNPTLSLDEKKALLMMPLPKFWAPLGCHITRDRSGFTKKFYPKYSLYLNLHKEPLMYAQKMQIMRSAYYLITMEKKNMEKTAPGCLGKLRSNFKGSEYNFFDKGENPESKLPLSQIRNQLGAVIFETSLSFDKYPREMHVLIPEINSGTPYNWKPLTESEYMIQKFRALSRDRMLCFTNKAPKWNPTYQAYCLNFHNPEIKSSVKNLQVIDPIDSNFLFLQFGRVNDDLFSLEFRYPFSLFQAFALCLCSCDYND